MTTGAVTKRPVCKLAQQITECAISHHSFNVGKSSHVRGSKMDISYDSDFELPKKRKPFGELSTNVPSRRQQGEAEFEDKKSKRVTKKKRD